MTAFNFGVGSLWAARTDIANPTPAQFGTLQDISVDFDFTSKPLMGQYQIAVASRLPWQALKKQLRRTLRIRLPQ